MPVAIGAAIYYLIVALAQSAAVALVLNVFEPIFSKAIRDVQVKYGLSDNDARIWVANFVLDLAEIAGITYVMLRTKLPLKIANMLGFTSRGFVRGALPAKVSSGPNAPFEVARRVKAAGKPSLATVLALGRSLLKPAATAAKAVVKHGWKIVGSSVGGLFVLSAFIDYAAWEGSAYQSTFQKIFSKVGLSPDSKALTPTTVSSEVFTKVYETYRLEGATQIRDPYKGTVVPFNRQNMVDLVNRVGAELQREKGSASAKDILANVTGVIVFGASAPPPPPAPRPAAGAGAFAAPRARAATVPSPAPRPQPRTVAAPVEEIRKYYRSDLNREPTQGEIDAWARGLASGKSSTDLQIELLASSDEAVGFQQTPQQRAETVRWLRQKSQETQQVFAQVAGRPYDESRDFASSLFIEIGSRLESGQSASEVISELRRGAPSVGLGSGHSSSHGPTDTPKVFTGVTSQGGLGDSSNFVPRPDDLITDMADLRQAAANNIAPFLASVPGRVVYEIKLVSSYVDKSGYTHRGTSTQVQSGTYANGTPKYKMVYNKFAVAELYMLSATGTRTKIDTIVLGPTDAARFQPSPVDVDGLTTELRNSITTSYSSAASGESKKESRRSSRDKDDDEKKEEREDGESASFTQSKQDALYSYRGKYYYKSTAYRGTYRGISPGSSLKRQIRVGQVKVIPLEEWQFVPEPDSKSEIEKYRLGEWPKAIDPATLPVAAPPPMPTPLPPREGETRGICLASTLAEYYGAQGQSLPSVADRQPFYEALGLGPAAYYTGTAEQNVKLLDALQARDGCGT